MKQAWKIAAPLIVILLMAVVFAPGAAGTVWLSRLHDFAHAPIFGCVAVLLLFVVRRHPRAAGMSVGKHYAAALVMAVSLGLLTEIAQIPTRRDASWLDVRHDLLGAIAFLAFFALVDPGARSVMEPMKRRLAALLLGGAISAYLLAPLGDAALKYRERRIDFPVIADFTSGFDPYFVWKKRIVATTARLPVGLRTYADEAAVHVRFLPEDYPGLSLHEPWPDWRGYSMLAIDLANPADRPLELVVRVHDAHHDNALDDRYNATVIIPAHTREVRRFALADIRRAPRGRVMDMREIRGVVVFRPDRASPDEMYVSRVWLE